MGLLDIGDFPIVNLNLRETRASVPARSRALVPVAAASGMLWVVAVWATGTDLPVTTQLALGVAGLLVTTLILLLVQGQHSSLRVLAVTDALTGLVNHRSFHEQLAADLDAARVSGTSLALVTLDLDSFKAINDEHGYPYGDQILTAVGASLLSIVRAQDTAARIGGEEFALILPGADQDAAYVVAERARAVIGQIPVHGRDLGCSAGVAAYPQHASDAPTLVQLGDSALYWAKHSGRRRTRRYDPDHASGEWSERQRAEVEHLLTLADPIVCAFQPVVSIATGRLIGYEALARFPSQSGRAPDSWFAQAHGCGLGPDLEAAALRAALGPAGRPLETHLAVNVSPSALASDKVQRVLCGNLEGLVIEITEHEFVPDDDSLAIAIADLRARGARIAVDDAGAGHAGLKQLMRVRPDIVKLDRALISGIHEDRAQMALVESFVRFARYVGATVCAEGIESLDELAVLADLDVDWGQGYVLARPDGPWAQVSPVAAEVCRASLAEAFRSMPSERYPISASDRRLVHVSARLAGARTVRDVENALALIAAELDASKICISAWRSDRGVLETLAETGERSDQTVFPIEDYPLSSRILREQHAVQVVVGDPDSDPSEVDLLLALGERSLLMIPVVCRGESLGIIEAYRTDERGWTRTEINRARVIANQFSSVVATLSPDLDLTLTGRAKASDGHETRA